MTLTRRGLVRMGGGLVAALSLPTLAACSADEIVEIEMGGRSGGTHVWFDPIGIHLIPGQTIRWTNRDKGNTHTATAYHPANFDHPLRIPEDAEPWDSDYLFPGESFSVKLTHAGVYDYFCAPHEQAGMVGRIVVGEPTDVGWSNMVESDEGIPVVALEMFPPISDILDKGIVRRA